MTKLEFLARITEDICYEDLTPDLKDFCNEFGIETTRKMIQVFGGQKIYVTKPQFFKKAYKKNILGLLHNGKSLKDIALLLEITEDGVRKAVNRKNAIAKQKNYYKNFMPLKIYILENLQPHDTLDIDRHKLIIPEIIEELEDRGYFYTTEEVKQALCNSTI